VADIISFVVALLLLAASLAPIYAAKSYDPSARPSSRVAIAFDRLFRAAGSLLPVIPWVLRSIAFESLNTGVQSLQAICHPMAELFLQVLIQSLRFAFFGLHLAGQHFHCWYYKNGQCSHKQHLFADHAFLAIAVQACLAVEIAASAQTLHRLSVQHKLARAVSLWSFFLYGAAFMTALVLLVLTTGEVIDTAKYFHPMKEIVAAVSFGAPLFLVPALAYLYSWSSLRDP
jgi:hypothetical protein